MWNNLYKRKKLNVWLDLSTYCNAACPQCHRTDPRTSDKMDWLPLIQWSIDEFKKAFPVDTLKHYASFQLCGTWGDPVMNKDIYEITKYILDFSSAKIVVNTNGSMRDPMWWWQYGYMNKDRVSVYFCVDGIDQEMHSMYRQKTDLNLVLENLEAYAEFSKASVFTVVFKHNEDYLKQIHSMCKKLGSHDHIFVPTDRAHKIDKFKYFDPNGELKHLEHSPKYGKVSSRTYFRVDDI